MLFWFKESTFDIAVTSSIKLSSLQRLYICSKAAQCKGALGFAVGKTPAATTTFLFLLSFNMLDATKTNQKTQSLSV